MMNRYFLLVLVWAFFSAAAVAQAPLRFEPGFVVLVSGDSLRGDLVVDPDLRATREARFRAAGESEPTSLGPDAVLAYGTDTGRRFVRREVSAHPDSLPEPLFLRLLVHGDVSLYTFEVVPALDMHHTISGRTGRSGSGQRYALELRDGEVVPLFLVERYVLVDGSLRRATDPQYQRELARAFTGCEPAQRGTRRLRYRTPELATAVVRYNECVGATVAIAPREALRARENVQVLLSVRAGGGVTNLYQAGSAGSFEPAPYVGVSADLHFPAGAMRVSVPIDVAYRTYRTASETFSHPYSSEDMDRGVVVVSLGARYRIAAPTAPHATAGVLMGRALGDLPRGHWYLTPQGNMRFEGWRVPGMESGVFLEAGIQPGRIGFGVRLEAVSQGTMNVFHSFTASDNPLHLRARNVLAAASYRF